MSDHPHPFHEQGASPRGDDVRTAGGLAVGFALGPPREARGRAPGVRMAGRVHRAAVGGLLALVGCRPAAARAPDAPARPPTPASVTRDNPGGDAEDPERAAFERLLAEPWGQRPDWRSTLLVPLADASHWATVLVPGHPTRVNFAYGDDRYAMTTVWYTPAGGPDDPETCLDRFLLYAADVAAKSAVNVGPHERIRTPLAGPNAGSTPVELLEGSGAALLLRDDYIAAVAARPSWPGTCLVIGLAVVATDHRVLADKVRRRWVAEGASRLAWRPEVREAPKPTAK